MADSPYRTHPRLLLGSYAKPGKAETPYERRKADHGSIERDIPLKPQADQDREYSARVKSMVTARDYIASPQYKADLQRQARNRAKAKKAKGK